MKTLLFLFSVCFIETFVVAGDEPLQTGPVLVRSQKKKQDSFVHKKLNILNRRYLKVPEGQPGLQVKIKPPKKAAENNNAYTVFPPIQEKGSKVANLPDSPYFPLEKYAEYKPRVKKVLPEFLFKSAIRRKRSAAKPKSKVAVTKSKPDAPTITHGDKRTDTLKAAKDKHNSKKEKGDKNGKDDNTDENKEKGDKKDEDGKTEKENKKQKTAAKAVKSVKQAKPKKLSPKTNKEKLNGKSRSKSKPKSKPKSKKAPKRLRKTQNKKGRAGRRGSEKPSRRLIASNDASIETYPYTISIQKDRQHWCSGALLNPKLAITTANCMWKSDRISRMRIRAGSRYTDRGGQEAKIQEVMKHPMWSIRKGPDHDLALLYLDRMLRFSHTCHGVDLPNRAMYPVFEDAWITSWGAERRDGIYERPLTLQVYHADVIDRALCNNITQRFGVGVTANFICLAQTGRRAPCTRDTGAPAVSDGVLWGLASWGIRKLCGTERFPAMFSFTASHSNMDFISKATTYLMSDQRLQPFPDRYPFEFSRKPTIRQSGTEPTVGGMEVVEFQQEMK